MPKLSLAKLERHLYSAADRLRQEGLDAATYKDYIFGMLFLKRCSDVFEAEHDRIVGRKVEEGMVRDEAEARYGENPDYYDGFFVPERARWRYLQSRLGDATEPYGKVLDKALGALSEHNESLEHVLDYISFMRAQGTKRIVSDDACKDLVRHFSRHRLRNEDFQFSDLLGAAYEFLINMFAESAGKKGGDFYTPRDVIRLMVRILKPRPGLSVYDPTCGSGGMLIISREFVEQSGGDPTDLRLCGQVNDASAWSICKLNMLLHGVPGADIQLADTLLHPLHRDGGELERFDRVIANPPFSQNYTRSGMEFPERFRWGWCPTSGKKGDLMFAQHMLAVCKPGGMVATVMPHGVLFRGGAEKEIRRKWLEQDLLEAVIGLPPNLFYGAGIPACILVLRPNLTGQPLNPHKPAERRGQVLFVNADAEFHAGRAQNYLRPEHIEKIVSTFDRFEDVPGYARRVALAEIGGSANDWNLNIRRYVDNSPPPEPHDVRAHLLGGVPVAEVAAKQALFEALGFAVVHAFVARTEEFPPSIEGGWREAPGGSTVRRANHPGADAPPLLAKEGKIQDLLLSGGSEGAYFDFAPALADRAAIRPRVENDPGVQTRIEALRAALAAWWAAHAPRLADLPEHRQLNRVRAEFLDTFGAALLPLGTLDRFKLAGVIATWWTETLPDFKTLLENGFPGVIDGWVDAIADAVEDDEAAGPAFDPFGHKLVRRVMADYLERIAAAKADIARFKGEKEAFEQGNPPDDADEEELANWNQARDLERQMKELKAENREALKELAKLEKASAKTRASLFDGRDAVAAAKARLLPVLERMAAIEAELAPYEDIKKQLTEARARYRELTAAFVDVLKFRCDALSKDEKRDLVLELFARDVRTGLDAAVNEKRQELVRFLDGLWDKYRVTLSDLRISRSTLEKTACSGSEGISLLMSAQPSNSEWSDSTIRGCLIDEFPGSWGSEPGFSGPNAYVLRSTNLDDDGHIDFATAAERVVSDSDLRDRRLLEGDILLETSGGGPGKPVGRVAHFQPPSLTTYLCSNFFRTLRPNPNKVGSRFLAWLLLFLHRQPSIWNFQQQTTGIINLKTKGYLDQRIPLPDRSEQSRIAAVLDTVDEAIAKTEAVIAKLKQVRAGLLHDLLTRGLDENGQLRDPIAHPEQFQDSPIGRIPRGWRISTLGAELPLQRGFDITVAQQRQGEIPVVSSSGITSFHDAAMVGGPGVVTGRKGKLGAVFYIDKDFWPHDTSLWVTDFRSNSVKFAALLLSQLRLEQFDAATSVPTLNRNTIHPLQLTFPSRSEQEQLVSIVETWDESLDSEYKWLDKLKLLKSALMADLLTGRVRVPADIFQEHS